VSLVEECSFVLKITYLREAVDRRRILRWSHCKWRARTHHFELALYADDTAIIATSRKPALLVSYLESYVRDLKRWLRKWRIAISVSKSTAMLITRRRFQSSSSSTARGALDKRLTWSSHIDRDRKKAAQSLGVLGSLLNRRSGHSVRNGVLLYMQFIRPTMDCACRIWRSAAWDPRQEASGASIQVSSRCYWCTGTATLFKCVLSADVKSVSEKCWLHTYCVRSFLVCSALQVFPSLCSQQCPVQQWNRELQK
jgi:hypothetical protein